MSNLKKIGNKLFKETTELKSEKIELGLIDDMATRYKALSKDTSVLLNKQTQYFKLKREMKTLLSVLQNSVKAQEKDIDKATTAAKELGFDDKQFSAYIRQAQEISQEVKSIDRKIS